MAKQKIEVTRGDILRLAAEAEIDPRTVKRAIERGVDTVRAEIDRSRLRAAATRLGVRIE